MNFTSGNFKVLVGEASNLKGYLAAVRKEIAGQGEPSLIPSEEVVRIIDNLLTGVPMLQGDTGDILVLQVVRPGVDTTDDHAT